ncbi:hypothetical protein [Streptomyces sp. PU-14G]|uniref:hypothetical protein n=1 Tax=Streptomyces sp. PU-14G TaxID=2800808 RepID=UPI0034DEF113
MNGHGGAYLRGGGRAVAARLSVHTSYAQTGPGVLRQKRGRITEALAGHAASTQRRERARAAEEGVEGA